MATPTGTLAVSPETISNDRGRGTISPLEGCDATRPAIAHDTDGVPLSAQPAYRPIPCQTVVGLSSEDADVGFARSGTLFYAPLVQNTSTPPNILWRGRRM
jgi:hypothetical protein